MIRFTCPQCGKAYNAPDGSEGKSTTCKKCGRKIEIKAAPADPKPRPSPLATVDPKPADPDLLPRAQFIPAAVRPNPPAVMPPVIVPAVPVATEPQPDYKPCPFCAEDVKATAKKCRHCGETIDVTLRASEEAAREAMSARREPNVYMNAGGASSSAASGSGGCLAEFARLIFGAVMLVLFLFAGCVFLGYMGSPR